MYQPLTNAERTTLAEAAVILTTKIGPQWLTCGASPDRRLADAVRFLYDVLDDDAGDRPEIDADLVIAPGEQAKVIVLPTGRVKLDFPTDADLVIAPDDAKLDSPASTADAMSVTPAPIGRPAVVSAHAHWIEDQQVYMCRELAITSEDGDEWLDCDGRLAGDNEFEIATILLHGGPRDGTIVA